MFTAVEIEWLKAFLNTYITKGEFKSYVAYTIDNVQNYTNNEQYDFYVLISNEKIYKSGLAYETQGTFQLIKVDSSGASNNYHDARYVIETGIGKKITLNEYNHVYSNVENCLDADIIALETYNKEMILMQQETNYIYMLFIGGLMLISILNNVLKSAFPNKVGD